VVQLCVSHLEFPPTLILNANSSPFLELSSLAGHELYEDVVPCGGIITGVGRVNGYVYVRFASS
jgi:acetyl-CoA carboxylase carboxyltransferase component